MELSNPSKIIVRTADEMLNFFHNRHFQDYISALIDIKIYESMKPDDKVGEREGYQMGNKKVMIEITAKEMLEKMIEKRDAQKRILDAIKKVREEL